MEWPPFYFTKILNSTRPDAIVQNGPKILYSGALMNQNVHRVYNEYSKNCRPDDFWGQVKRTVNGVPASQDQIDMIVSAVVAGLTLNKQDRLLDLCCGNGALSSLLLKHCKGGLGVDFSEYLISVANANFAAPPDQTYLLRDVVQFCENPVTPDLFSKAVCYASFAYIEHDMAQTLLHLLKKNFPNIKRVFIGNCPDKECLSDFYGDRPFVPGTENDPGSPLGIWRTQEEFISLAEQCGWQARVQKMPEKYFAAYYRYDVVLSRK
jgi:SAM-dependent methyltransferase